MRSSPLANALRAADFDHIELVGLDGRDEREFHSGGGVGVVWSRPLEAEARSRLRALINALPGGESARCHVPAFGLVFGTGRGAIRVSLCFRCNNACMEQELVALDAASREAQELLAFL
jgi:hypothetical protein